MNAVEPRAAELKARRSIRRVKGCICPDCVRDVTNGGLTARETLGCDNHPQNREPGIGKLLPVISPLEVRLNEIPDDGQWHVFETDVHWMNKRIRSVYNNVRQWNCESSMRHGILYVRRMPGEPVKRVIWRGLSKD